jgi:SPP1 family predicted phage head-tail adaptor
MSVFESLLNNTFTVSRRRRSPDGRGGWPIDYVEIGTVRGRLSPVASRATGEQVVAQREERQITHVLYVAAGADIERGDRVSVGDLTVDVEGVREPSKAFEHLEIDCRERQPEQQVESGS